LFVSSCGAIQPGDRLLSVDGIDLALTGGLAEVRQLLRSRCPLVRLELARDDHPFDEIMASPQKVNYLKKLRKNYYKD
jgi:hypothetical protein